MPIPPYPSAHTAARVLLFSLSVAASTSALAAYICTGPDGRRSYQDVPCPSSHQAERLHLHQRNTIGPAADRPAPIRQAIAARQPAVGMTVEELYRAFGQPAKVNANQYGNRRQDQLVYLKGPDTWFVYTDNGVVTALQHRPGTNVEHDRPPAPAVVARMCPSEIEIRNLEVDVGSVTASPTQRAAAQRRLQEARACLGQRRPGLGAF